MNTKTRHESNGEEKGERWVRWRRFCIAQSYILIVIGLAWFLTGMVKAKTAGGWSAYFLLGCYYVLLLFNKWRYENENRKTTTYDLRGADCQPPYITTAGDPSTPAFQAIVTIDPHTGLAALSEPQVPKEDSGEGLVPDLVGPLIGYRAWNLHKGRLVPLANNQTHWTRGVNVAVCLALSTVLGMHYHYVADFHCTCGFWAFSSFETTISQVSVPPRSMPSLTVFGKVELFGLVTEHTVGYRASHARIVELYGPWWSSHLRGIARMYQVPFKPYPNKRAIRVSRAANGVRARIRLWWGDVVG